MPDKLICAIVHDLLPSYADGLTSSTTNEAIEKHLTECADCAAALHRMQEPEPPICVPPAAEVDYLKMVRRRSTRKSLIIGIVLMLLGIAIISFRVFYVGSAVNAAEVQCNVSVSADTLNVNGTLATSGLAVSRLTFSDSSGMVQLKVYTAPKMFFNSSDFSSSYTAAGNVEQVRIDDLIIWENGSSIDSITSQLLAAANPFVGDMPSNSRIANILGVGGQFGACSNELQTAEEPYGWILTLETRIAENEEQAARNIMTADSYAMLAVIDNLGYVTWRYTTGDTQQEYTVTAAEATAYAGKDIKLCGRSAQELQTLLQSLSIKWSGVHETEQ